MVRAAEQGKVQEQAVFCDRQEFFCCSDKDEYKLGR